MPKFVSQAQRGLFYAAADDPEVAKRTGVKRSVAKQAVAEDKPGKLPGHVKDGKPEKKRNWYGGDKD